MISIILVTHGELGACLLKSAELIAGKQDDVKAFSLGRGDDIQEFSKKVEQAIKELTQKSEVLVLTDLFGGSPSNIVAANLKEYNFKCLAGVNLPMLLEALSSRKRSDISVDELVKICIDTGANGIKDIVSILSETF